MRSVMTNHFSMIPRADIQRSTFNRSHGYKTTFGAGYLVPIYVDEALPGDTFNLKLTTLARLATPIVPVMDNLYLDFFFFAVPNRLVWDNWQKFMGEQVNPGDSTDYLVPQVDFSTYDGSSTVESRLPGSIYDYFGLPVNADQVDKFLSVNALPFRAYWLIWNEWFRDENLLESFPVPKDDGPDPYDLYFNPGVRSLAPRCKRHDYFTSCLPWPQKGPGVEIPLGSEAAIKLRENWPIVGDNPTVRLSTTGALASGSTPLYSDSGVFGFGNTPTTPSVYDPKNTLYTDLSSATTVTINSLRQAFQLQKLLERDARGGTRYTEILRAHFGVVSPDARLQRPEYLGGGSVAMIINPVAQTSATASTMTPQGNLAAYGVCSSSGHGFTKSFVEHSIIIGMVCARADITYQNGVNRMWSRKTRWDFYWPALAHLGEQAVLNQEIFYEAASSGSSVPRPDNFKVFGYQERWAEYRYFSSQITGYFRSFHFDGGPLPSLDFWTFSQSFTHHDRPLLNSNFIVDSTQEVLTRALAVSMPDAQILFDSFFDIKCARPMPAYSVPGLMDHF